MYTIFCVAVGIGIGWVLFKQPQWAKDLLAKARAKLGV